MMLYVSIAEYLFAGACDGVMQDLKNFLMVSTFSILLQ